MNIVSLSAISELISAVNHHKQFDLGQYELISLRLQVSQFLSQYRISNTDNLLDRLAKDRFFYEEFLHHICVEPTSMFRDPELWIILKNELLPDLAKASEIRIWLPQCSSGEELFSLAVLLKEADLHNKASILVTGISSLYLKELKLGKFNKAKYGASENNYSKYNGLNEFNKLFRQKDQDLYFDTSFIRNINFSLQDITAEIPEGNLDLVLFRNRLLYFNCKSREEALRLVSRSLRRGGYLILGFRESLHGSSLSEEFSIVNSTEKIYQKK